jgi:hypothetical protein
LGEHEHRLLLTLHHIICDGWSLGVLVRELAVIYDAMAAGVPSPLPALPLQYADVAAWQRQWRHEPALAAQLAYWLEHLHTPLPVLALPTDRPRGSTIPLHTARQPVALPELLVEALIHLSQQEGTTLFMTCLAAFLILLSSYTGQEDLCVATLVANRTHADTEGLIGLLVNTVLLRTSLHGALTCREVLQRVRATTLEAYAHQDVPFEEVLRALEAAHNLQCASLCQVMVVWQNAMLWPMQLSAHALSFETLEQGVMAPDVALTTFDLVLTLRERPQGLTGSCLYKTELFDASTIRRMLDDFQKMLSLLSVQVEQDLAAFHSLRSV